MDSDLQREERFLEELPSPGKLAHDERFLRRGEVERIVGAGRNFVYSHPGFPRPVRISPRLSVWLESQVRAWMAQQVIGHSQRDAA